MTSNASTATAVVAPTQTRRRRSGRGLPRLLDLLDRAPHDPPRDPRPVAGEGDQQRAVADDVDQPGHAAREGVHLADRAAREERTRAAAGRGGHAVRDVLAGLGAVEAAEMPAHGDALVELLEVRARQQVAQLGLSDEHDLQQLRGLGLEVRQHPQLLERAAVERLRLVDHHHHAPAAPLLVEQEVVQRGEHLAPGAGRGDPELVVDLLHELEPGQDRVQDVGVLRGVVGAAQQRAQERGLAGADLAR